MPPLPHTATAAALAALLLASGAPAVHAAPPLVTIEAEALDKNDCQWQYSRDSARAGGAKARGWSTQVGCGVGGQTQFDVGFSRVEGGGARSDAVYLTGKTQTVRATEPGGADVAITYSWLGEREASNKLRTDTLSLSLLVSKPITDRFTGHLNIGFLKVKQADSAVTWGLAGEYALTDSFDLAFEAFGEDGSRPWLAAGVRWAMWDKARLYASHAVQRDNPQLKLTSAGIQLDF